MTAITIQVPNREVGFFKKMISKMGWSYTEEPQEKKNDAIMNSSLMEQIRIARQEFAKRETIVCNTPEEMQSYFNSL